MSKIEAIGDIVKTGGEIADNLTESSEERQEALSQRHSLDMVNGTWLTKNIRPLTLIMLLFYWIILIPILAAFDIVVASSVVNAVEMLSLAAFTFYFGGKSFEKVQVIKAKTERKEKRLKRKEKRRNG